ncbi:MAG: hypothetical protein JOZ69_22625, partial [Myxococcales bacterium]|nr:hypothetical protein [Myxococcales bacterium]
MRGRLPLFVLAQALVVVMRASAQPNLPPPPPPPIGQARESPPPEPSTPPVPSSSATPAPHLAPPPPPAGRPARRTTAVPSPSPPPGTPAPSAPPPPPPPHRAGPPPPRPHVARTYIWSPPEEPSRTLALTLNPLSIALGRLSGNLELLVAAHHALVLSANLLVAQVGRGGPGSLVSQAYGFVTEASGGLGAEVGYHYYAWRRRSVLRGPFVGPSVVVGSTTQ